MRCSSRSPHAVDRSPRSSSRRRPSTSIRLDDGKVEELTTGLDRGAGVRVACGTSYGYAYSNRLDRDALLEAAEAASAALREGESGRCRRPRATVGAGREPRRAPGRRRSRPRTRWRGCGRSTTRRGRSARRSAGRRRLRRLAAAAVDRDLRRPLGRGGSARGSGWSPRWSPRGDGNIQTGFHGPAACAGVEFVDRHPPAGHRPRWPRVAPSRCSTRSRRRRAR